MRVNRVSAEALADAADAVAERIDVFLERATDAVVAAPRPGSPRWREAWAARGSIPHRDDLAILWLHLGGRHRVREQTSLRPLSAPRPRPGHQLQSLWRRPPGYRPSTTGDEPPQPILT